MILHAWRASCTQHRTNLAELEVKQGAWMPGFEKKIQIGHTNRTVEEQLRHNADLRHSHLIDSINGAGYRRLLEIEEAMKQEGSDLLQQLCVLSDAARLYSGLHLCVLTSDYASEITRVRSLSVSEWFVDCGFSCESVLSDGLGSEDIVCQLRIEKHDKQLRSFYLAGTAAAASMHSWSPIGKDQFDVNAFIQLAAWQMSGCDLASLSTLSRGHYCSFLAHAKLHELLEDSARTFLNLAGIAAHLESHFNVVRRWEE